MLSTLVTLLSLACFNRICCAQRKTEKLVKSVNDKHEQLKCTSGLIRPEKNLIGVSWFVRFEPAVLRQYGQ